MNEQQTITLLTSLANKTRNHNLVWNCLCINKDLFKFPRQSYLDNSATFSAEDFLSISYDNSYFCEILGGYLFLIAYTTSNLFTGATVRFYVQKHSGNHSVCYSTTDHNDSKKEITALKRLYTLVESSQISCDDILESLFDNDEE